MVPRGTKQSFELVPSEDIWYVQGTQKLLGQKKSYFYELGDISRYSKMFGDISRTSTTYLIFSIDLQSVVVLQNKVQNYDKSPDVPLFTVNYALSLLQHAKFRRCRILLQEVMRICKENRKKFRSDLKLIKDNLLCVQKLQAVVVDIYK